MNPVAALAELIDRPESLLDEPRPAGLGRAAFLGYFAGTFGAFAFLRLFGVVPPGVVSFLVVFTFVLAANWAAAGATHLFMDLTGARGGGAGRLYLAFGLSDYLFALLVPLGLLSKLGLPGAFASACFCLLLVVWARTRYIARLYPVSRNKAALGVVLPYAAGFSLAFLAFVYWFAWLIWLML